MSELSKAIERYGNGIADASEVIAALPKPSPQKAKATLGELEDSEKAGIAKGTWEEVSYAHWIGTLNDDQYAELYEAYLS
jgi:hypothetical protein